MKHIRKFESYAHRRKLESVIKESVMIVDDVYKVNVTAEIPQSLLNAYIKKVKDNLDKNARQFFSDVQLAEEITKYVLQQGLNIDKIEPSALFGGAQSQGGTQVQVQTQGSQVQVQAQAPQAQVQPVQAQAPQGQAQVPQGQAQVPQGQAQVPQGQAQVPQGQAQVPQGQAQVPQGQAQVPQSQAQGEFEDISDDEEENDNEEENDLPI